MSTMTTEQGEPIYEQVCTATELRIVGFGPSKDVVTDEELSFSSGIPLQIGPDAVDLVYITEPTALPGVVVTPINLPPDDQPTPIAEVAAPGAFILFVSAAILWWSFREFKKVDEVLK